MKLWYERIVVCKLRYSVLAIIAMLSGGIFGHDLLVEFKGAYFLPTNDQFRDIYGGSALYGPEVTFEFCNQLYGFVSIDFFQKNGHSLGDCSPTQITLVPIGIGFKYLVPFCLGDFYVGIGFQPTLVQIVNCSPFVIPEESQWGFGGIAKVGTYFDLPCDLFCDVFIDYSFLNVCFKGSCPPNGPVVPHKAHVSGAIFGVGLGYRF